jgi:hypothetical protein
VRQLDPPNPEVSARVIRCIYEYELDLDDFFFGSRWDGDPWDGGQLVGINWCVRLNDTFYYATADAETIIEENIGLFEKICEWSKGRGAEYAAPLLFAVKLRNRKPIDTASQNWLGDYKCLLDQVLEENFNE